MISHDWHVQPSCQRPNRDPPRRHEFSPGETLLEHSDCPRNFTTIQCGLYPVNHHFPQNFQMISTSGIREDGRAAIDQQVPHRACSPIRNDNAFGGRSLQRATVWSSARNWRHFRRTHFATARTEDKKLRKDLYYLEVLALKVPFGSVLLSE
jgi:hypothetical protein